MLLMLHSVAGYQGTDAAGGLHPSGMQMDVGNSSSGNMQVQGFSASEWPWAVWAVPQKITLLVSAAVRMFW